jgi:hypothetical protein
MCIRNSIFSIIFKEYQTAQKEKYKIPIDTYKWSQKLHRKKFFFAQTQKKSSIKLD